MKSKQLKLVAILALTAALSGYGQETRGRTEQEHSSRTNKWHMQAGWVHQYGRSMSVSGPAPSLLPHYRRRPSGADLTYPDNNAFTPRNFDDGYVHPDMWTGDAGLLADPNPERYGMTWNWGADSAGQYNYDGGAHPTLTYHIDRGQYADSVYAIAGDKLDDDYESNGVEIKLRRLLHAWIDTGNSTNEASDKTVLDVSLVLGLAWFPKTTQRARRAIGQDLYSVRETYTYPDYYGTAAGGSWPALAVPYAGTYGSMTDAGSLIPVTPESASLQSSYRGAFVDRVAIESDLWHLRGAVGIELVKPLTQRLEVYVAPQFVLEFVDMDAERTETVVFTDRKGTQTQKASRTDKNHKTTFIPGVLLTAGADYRFTENWFAGASFGWEELTSNPHMNVGSDRIKYDLSGGEFSVYIGRRF